ncbi:phosphatidylglycerophosphatase A [Steroidobacter sp. S1-65]|uniref:Phosphatidylglycerophosphatase A n=1 Tax=Steroidobacter gossypii TaxID=2805490 RepID=A0ABS1X1B8_9GAMM|nr:phosphatidylglycerophosphatase A [Steroidobacter gossypii]MBM0107033.1 phosphatidylglycerophosphatase A [Steroidobacter gossypii]
MKWSADPALMRDPIHLLAFGFGAGLSPWAPGTFGTLIAIPITLFVMQFGFAAHLGFAIVASLFGIYVCGESARRLGVHDHPGIVWDEIAGFAVTMLGVPLSSAGAPSTLYVVLAGFALFRLLDIWKPWPIREADHSLPGGLGIMLDDIIAGIFAAAILLGIRYIL